MPRRPTAIGDVLAELMAKKGFGRVQSARAYEAAWREAAGELLAEHTRLGALRRGVLEVTVGNSTLLQELVFRKGDLLVAVQQQLPEEGIGELRFRLGAVG
jgi:predicted nucleic acid-binding Zn ribbon protein